MFLFQHKHLCLLMKSRRKPPSGLHALRPVVGTGPHPGSAGCSQQVPQASQPLWRKQTWGHDLLHCNKQVLMEPPVNFQFFLGSSSAQGRRQKDMEQRNQIRRIKRTGDFFMRSYVSSLPFGRACGASSLHSFRVGEGFTDKREKNAPDIQKLL